MNPLQESAPLQIPLSRAPLDHVVCQVKFPAVLMISVPGFVGPFQEQIRARYPRVSENAILRFQLKIPGNETPANVSQPQAEFRFQDEDQRWSLTLGQDFLALHSQAYTSRDEFLERLSEVLLALESCIHPSHCTRLGIRYIDRIKEAEDLQQVSTFFRPEVLGLASSLDMVGQVGQVFSESLMTTREGKLLARWGLLPANTTYDPLLVAGMVQDSWILDLDSFSEERKEFHTASVMADATALAERSYAFFRWSITDAFVEQFR